MKLRTLGAPIAALVLVLGTSVPVRAATDVERAFVREFQAMNAGHAQAIRSLAQRLSELGVDGVLAPRELVTTAGIEKARRAVVAYRALLSEREELLARTDGEISAFFKKKSPTAADRASALASYELVRRERSEIYAQLQTSQTFYIDAVSAVVEWCASQAERLTVRDGRFEFEDAQQQAELQRIVNALGAAEDRLNNTVRTARETQSRAHERQVEAQRTIERLLTN